MGFLTNIVSGVIKVAVTPLVVVKDIVSDDEELDTPKVLGSALEDIDEGFEDLLDGDII